MYMRIVALIKRRYYILDIKSHIFVSYFIHNKPTITFIKDDNNDMNNLTIGELQNVIMKKINN